jgi:hypothetical protein
MVSILRLRTKIADMRVILVKLQMTKQRQSS